MTARENVPDLSERLRNDMDVIALDGDHIGHIVEVRPHDFLLHRPLSRSVFVPFDAIDTVSEKDNRVTLRVSEGHIAEAGWPSLDDDVSGRRPLGGR